MQTLRTGCSKAKPNIFAPLQTPFPGAQDGQNLIGWRWSLPSPTDPVWWDRCTQSRVIVVTDPQTTPARCKQTGPITIHCTAKLSMQCKYVRYYTIWYRQYYYYYTQVRQLHSVKKSDSAQRSKFRCRQSKALEQSTTDLTRPDTELERI